MKRFFQNTKLKLIAATSVTIFSLLVVFVGTYAWFQTILHQERAGENFEVKNLDTAVSEIEIYEYLGPTNDNNYAFNPSPTATIAINNGAASAQTYSTITLGEFSIEDPHHPVLVLYKVSGSRQAILGKTNYPFLAMNKPNPTTTAASYSAMNSAASSDSYSVNDLIEIASDSTQNNKNVVYQYTGKQDNVPQFKIAWIDIAQNGNPLSSVIETHSFTFASKPSATTKNVYLYHDNERDETTTSTSCISLAESGFTDSNRNAFVNIVGEDLDPVTPFNDEIYMFDGDITEVSYVGIVIDYSAEALIYISSYFLGNDYLNEGLGFTCDWITEI